jgi:hypothetical protein
LETDGCFVDFRKRSSFLFCLIKYKDVEKFQFLLFLSFFLIEIDSFLQENAPRKQNFRKYGKSFSILNKCRCN